MTKIKNFDMDLTLDGKLAITDRVIDLVRVAHPAGIASSQFERAYKDALKLISEALNEM